MPWWVDLVVLAILALYFYSGWRRGFLASILPIVGMILGYLAAYKFYLPVGKIIITKYAWSPIIAYPLGGLAAFLLVTVFFSLLGSIIERRRRIKAANDPEYRRKNLDSWLGGGFKTATGILLIVIVVWIWNLFTLAPFGKKMPSFRNTITGHVSTAVTEKGVYYISLGISHNPASAQWWAFILSDPQRALEGIQKFLANVELQKLMQDQSFSQAMAKGDQEAIFNHPGLNKLIEDKEFLAAAKQLNFAGPGADETAIKKKLADKMAQLGQKMNSLRDDQALQDVLNDPEVMKLVEAKDYKALAAHPKFNKLMEKVVSKPAP